MKILSNKTTETNVVELEIEVGSVELEEAIQKVFEREGKNIAVQGFRKGKAPRKIIEKMYGKGIFLEDAVNELYPTAYSEAIKEAKLDPVAPGDIEIIDADPEKGFTFKATVTVKPEINIKDYKGIAAEKEIKEVTDKHVETEIEKLRERGARLVEVTGRKAKNGDTSIIDFEGFVDDVPFEGGKGENHELVLGSGSFIPGFEDQIVGKKIGEEFDVKVTFPEEYHADNLAGKEAVFKVKLNELKEKELPELDDEFAKDVSEFDTLAEMKADLFKNLQEAESKKADDELENQLVDKVIEKIQGEIPEIMYEIRVDEMVKDFSQRLSSQGMTLELYLQYTGMELKDFRKTFREQAERQVKIRLALDKIVELEKITPTEEDLEKEYDKMAKIYGMESEQIKNIIPVEHFTSDVAANKAIDLIRSEAKITEKMTKSEEKVKKAVEEKPKKAATKPKKTKE